MIGKRNCIQPVLCTIILLIVTTSGITKENRTEWFKCLDKFDESAENVWDPSDNTVVKLDVKWKDEDGLETDSAGKCRNSSVGQKKV